jgi:hypothetical protein
MSGDHWQIVKHESDGRHTEGGFETLSIAEARRPWCAWRSRPPT